MSTQNIPNPKFLKYGNTQNALIKQSLLLLSNSVQNAPMTISPRNTVYIIYIFMCKDI